VPSPFSISRLTLSPNEYSPASLTTKCLKYIAQVYFHLEKETRPKPSHYHLTSEALHRCSIEQRPASRLRFPLWECIEYMFRSTCSPRNTN
jgi:hypothetical protein